MASNRARRVAKELADIQADASISHITAHPVDGSGDLTHLKASITGPPGTPYEGGHYVVDVKIPTEYPFRPPIMKFDTKVWHPNISSQTSLFESPEPKDPQDAEVAKMMMSDPPAFNKKAHEWAVQYAGARRNPAFQSVKPRSGAGAASAPQTVDESRYQGYNKDLIDRFVNMGFDIDRVVEAFLYVGIDKNDGMDYTLEEAYMGDITARLLGEP
ncbi:hypothetical protein DL766_006018 [Monosporascus sp. MC13-8B]|uniref:UBC core domain-containing protein n=1 Tax=Monosporascus cannonballus TaxID=155416 RepID=A0ABY0GXL4_9PEZI|nr:hypothetical protein DL762_007971 [Monosporascus cannonballus]RYO80498.1 hypothetical protein DL763_008900 [Monosporascus cannonballus]RYP28210.1 hypothetical protein DL766_006018 [Monosporascus sp. MC13-8B]